MKFLISPIALIVSLVVFFVVSGCRDFNRDDDVQTVQGENLSTNRKASASVPETKSMAEEKPSVETNPVETKNVAETKPVTDQKNVTGAKPVEEAKANPDDTKIVGETNVVETTPEVPVAVPVATVEEAEIYNVIFVCYTLNNLF